MTGPIIQRQPLAAVTSVGDDAALLPYWLRHYTAQLGAAHCYVIDAGGTVGPENAQGAAVIRLPAGAQDAATRATFLEGFCSALLEWYDAVLQTEQDEIVMADPAIHPDLAAYAAAGGEASVLALGHAVMHHPTEPPIDPARPVLAQRHYVQFRAALCRTVLWRQKRRWPPGVVQILPPPAFGGLYLFHLRLFDRATGLRQLQKSRALPPPPPPPPPPPGWWNSAPDDVYLRIVQQLATQKVNRNMDLTSASRVAWHTISQLLPAAPDTPAEDRYSAYETDELWPVPDRFC